MSWWAVGIAAVGAVKGTMDANAANKRQQKNDAYRKAAITYSPWTQMGDPGSPDVGNTNAFSGALGGGLQGAATGAMIGKSTGAYKTAAPTPTDTTQATPDMGAYTPIDSSLQGGPNNMYGMNNPNAFGMWSRMGRP